MSWSSLYNPKECVIELKNIFDFFNLLYHFSNIGLFIICFGLFKFLNYLFIIYFLLIKILFWLNLFHNYLWPKNNHSFSTMKVFSLYRSLISVYFLCVHSFFLNFIIKLVAYIAFFLSYFFIILFILFLSYFNDSFIIFSLITFSISLHHLF